MPAVVAGNTNAAVLAIAEKKADLVLARWGYTATATALTPPLSLQDLP